MPDEVAQIIAHCEERLIKAKIITRPFSATEIQGGILKEYLIDEDYLAPQKVNFADHHYSSRMNHCYFQTPFLLMGFCGSQQTKLSATYYLFLYLQREERLEVRHLALQKAIEQQTHPKTEEEEGKNLLLYITAASLECIWCSL